jgi:hypothetical protein
MTLKDKLSVDERAIYDDLYIKSKELYPNLIEDMYEQAIVYYIKSGLNDDCFQELIEKNKKSSVKEEEDDIKEVL